jgi:acetylornithine deacetylase/succinyl-diaminopimelate desuccinylase-like protein
MPARPQLAEIFAHIDAQRDGFLKRLIDYVRHPSISAHNLGIREVADLLVRMLGELGLEAQLVPTAGHPMVVARWLQARGAPTILLYGHYDVQPPDPLELWVSPPFEPTIRDNRVYARGVADNKGQHLAQILAIESHLKVRGRLPCNVILLLEGEEEIGSPHIADFVRAHRDLLKADLAVTADGPLHPSGLHQDPRYRGLCVRQCRRGEPRAERESEDRVLLQWHPHRRGAAGGTRADAFRLARDSDKIADAAGSADKMSEHHA